jgi:hypothetical protein
VSGYGLDARVIEVRSQAGAEDFSCSLCSDRLWGPPSLLSNGYRGSFSRVKVRPGRDADYSPHVVPRSLMSRSYTSSPPTAYMACSETVLLIIFGEEYKI